MNQNQAGRPKRSDHARTYSTKIAGIIHRRRLRALQETISQLELPQSGELADFGCSDGYILERLLGSEPRLNQWKATGFDNKEWHLEAAEARQIENTRFEHADLNQSNEHLAATFDLVTCLETLEHVGNPRSALNNVVHACKPGGDIVISVPNESGVAGTVKFLGRMVLRRNAYGNFFEGKSRWSYLRHLITGRRLDGFRTPERYGWPQHLGFDIGVFDEMLRDDHVGNTCQLVNRQRVGVLGFNVFYHLRATHPQRNPQPNHG